MRTFGKRFLSGAIVGIVGLLGSAIALAMPTLGVSSEVAPSLELAVRAMPEGMGIDLVTDVVEKEGVLWVTTYQGLVRYDGGSWRRYTHEATNPRSLAYDLTVRLLEDRRGDLWVCGQGALHRYIPSSDDFERFAFDGIGPPALDDAICFSLAEAVSETGAGDEAGEGALWVGTNQGLLRFDRASRDFRFFEATLGYPISGEVLPRGEDHLWIASSKGGVYSLELGSGALDPVTPPRDGSFGSFCLLRRPDGEIWVGANPGLYRLVDGPEPRLEELPLGKGRLHDLRINHLLADDTGLVWLASSQGLYAYDEESGRLHSQPVNSALPLTLGSQRVMRLHIDGEGVLWIGTLDGLYSAELRSRYLSWLNLGFEQPETSVTDLAADSSGRLFIATRGEGLWIRHPSGRVEQFRASANGRGLASDAVRALALEGADRLWVGSDEGLQSFDPATSTFTRHELGTETEQESVRKLVDSLLVDGDRILAGQSRELSILSTESGEVRHLGAEEGLGAGLITVVRRASRGGYWVGSLGGGVAHLSEDLGRITALEYSELGMAERPSMLTNDLLDDGETLWIATMEGVLELDSASLKVRPAPNPIAQLDKPSNLVTGEDGNLWVATMKDGLLRFDPRQREVVHLKAGDGLRGDFLGAGLRMPGGHLAFGGNHGVVLFDPAQVGGNPVLPKVKAELAAGRQDESAQPFVDGAVLPHDRNTVRIRLAGTSLAEPQRNRFRYRLEGFDSKMHEVGSDELDLRYTLDPGGYVLHASASNNSGRWGEPAVVARFVIERPPWLRWWAWCAYGLALAALVLGLVHNRTRFIRRLNRSLEKQVEEKTGQLEQRHREIVAQAETIRQQLEDKETFFSNVSHEIRTPLTIIRGLMHKAAEPERVSEREIEVMERNIHRLLRMVDQLLQLGRSRALSQSGSPDQPVRLENLVEEARLAFEPLCRANQLELTVQARGSAVVAGCREALETILGNLLSNAVKYTPTGGKVELRYGREAEEGVLEVEDSGLGFTASELERAFEPYARLEPRSADAARSATAIEGFGLGLPLVKELVEAGGGRLSVRSEPGRGSCFSLRFPLLEGAREGAGSSPAEASPDAPSASPSPGLAREVRAAEHSSRSTEPSPRERPLGVSGDGPVLLIVDDDPDLRDYLRRLFEHDFAILEAADGEEALELAREHIPTLIVSDVMMPRLGGFELTAALRADELTCHIPIVLLTARGSTEAELRGLELRADDFVTKPFDEALLRARVDNLLDIRAVLRGAWKHPGETADLPLPPMSGEVEASATQPVNPSHLSARDGQFLERFLLVVDEVLGESTITVGDLAARLFLSESQLRRKLRALTGLSPSAHLRQRRLHAAAERLREGASIQEALFGSGFTSQSHFNNCFKAAFGTTPGQYASASARAPNPATEAT